MVWGTISVLGPSPVNKNYNQLSSQRCYCVCLALVKALPSFLISLDIKIQLKLYFKFKHVFILKNESFLIFLRVLNFWYNFAFLCMCVFVCAHGWLVDLYVLMVGWYVCASGRLVCMCACLCVDFVCVIYRRRIFSNSVLML